jgi:hypothetical protein
MMPSGSSQHACVLAHGTTSALPVPGAHTLAAAWHANVLTHDATAASHTMLRCAHAQWYRSSITSAASLVVSQLADYQLAADVNTLCCCAVLALCMCAAQGGPCRLGLAAC